MSNLTQFPDLEAAREEAALWVARIDRGLSAAEQTQLRQWLRNHANRRAFEDLGHLWESMDVMSVFSDLFPRTPTQQPSHRRAWIAGGALAASALATALLLQLPASPHRISTVAAPVTQESAVEFITSPVGEHRAVTLSDGSLLSLNTNTAVEIRMTGTRRILQLRRGEAHFEVAHDVNRPFLVTAGDHVVRAVGTAFNIRLRSNKTVDVLVTSGKVQVTPEDQSDNSTSVEAGQLLLLRENGHHTLQSLDAAEVESRLAWRRSVLIFDGETLTQVVQEIGRYSSRPIRLADTSLGQRRIVGYFPSNDLHSLLNALRASLDLQIRESDTEIVLSANRGAPPN